MTVTIAVDPNLTSVVAPVPCGGDPAWICSQTGASLVCTNTSALAPNGENSFAMSAAR